MSETNRYVVAWTDWEVLTDDDGVTVGVSDLIEFEVFADEREALRYERAKRERGLVVMFIDVAENGYKLVEVDG